MQKRLGVALATVGLLAVPVAARAQAHMSASHEFGADIAVFYQSLGNSGGNGLVAKTPVDLRMGWVSSGNMSWEGRLNLTFSTIGTTTYNIDPGVNVLFKMGQSHAANDNMYFTVGADVQIINAGTSGATPAINGGIGWRKPWGSAAWRLEPGIRYVFSNTSLGTPSALQIGIRAGVSLWH